MSDLIDRQAAIDAINKLHDKPNAWLDLAVDALEKLPSAQPEQPTEVQDILQYLDEYLHPIVSPEHWSVYSELYDMVSMLQSSQPEQRWIPCSERLPKHGGRYLISVLDGIERRTTVAPYLPRCKAWRMTGRMAYWKVIAWTPLPEPWKEGEADD